MIVVLTGGVREKFQTRVTGDLQVPGMGGQVDGIDSQSMQVEMWWSLRFVGENDEFSFEYAEVRVPWGIHMEKLVAVFTTQAHVAGEAWLLRFTG